MPIQRLQLERFRGAKALSLELDSRLNVFVGMNGSGKSSVLDAAAILLSWLVNRIKSTSASGRPIKESDIKNGEASARLAIELRLEERLYAWSLVKRRPGYRGPELGSSLAQATEIAKAIQAEISERNGHLNLPLFAYYPVNRAVLDIPLRIRARHQFDLLAAFDESLTSGANFRTFFEWFREREDLENEARRDQQSLFSDRPSPSFPDVQLQAVRTALSRCMPEFESWTVRRSPLRMEVDKNGVRLSVDQLSDGEKCLMAMIGDLARRMALAKPALDHSLHGDGVLLIDEVDLHLHPKWQRMLIPKLLEVFPNCQLLISTHSPHVITHVRPENLFLLTLGEDGLTAMRPEESYGKTVERVLEDLMGLQTARPEEVQGALGAIFEEIDRGKLAVAKAGIVKLEQRIGDDPELTKARVLIRRKELIGK
jgi:predicted ATP-binding protein involved in virulence